MRDLIGIVGFMILCFFLALLIAGDLREYVIESGREIKAIVEEIMEPTEKEADNGRYGR